MKLLVALLIVLGPAACLVAAPSSSAPAATTAPATSAAAPFAMPRGPFRVETTDVLIHDAAQNKDLELRVRIPVPASGTVAPTDGWPLVIFSHGAGGSRAAFADLLDFWASHGYASIAPTHADSIELRKRRGGADARELLTPEGRTKLLSEVRLGDRVADCTSILDRLGDVSAAVAQAGGAEFTINARQLAIAGHSAGAYTAQLAAGVKARAAGVGRRGLGFTSIGDARFKAAIIISGQGTASRLLGEDSWSDVKIPLFVITGSLDDSPPNMGHETPESRQHPFAKSRGTANGGPPAYLLFIEGATHSSYQGKATSTLLGEQPTTDVCQIQDSVATGTLVFLNAHLRAEAEALALLNGPRLQDTIPGKVRYAHK